MHRFFVDASSIAGRTTGSEITFPLNAARQAATVLRLRPGEVVAVFDGSGMEWTVRLVEVAASRTRGQVVEARHTQVEPKVALTLCQAVLKADRFEFVLQRCTEAGVARFQPFISERCVAEMPRGPKLERWERIVREAAKQSGRVVVPPILPVIGLADLPGRPDLRPAIALWESERETSLRAALDRLRQSSSMDTGVTNRASLSIVIGPEGGLEAREAERLAAAGIETVSIGPRVLRAETAALAATVAALYHLDEMGSESVD